MAEARVAAQAKRLHLLQRAQARQVRDGGRLQLELIGSLQLIQTR